MNTDTPLAVTMVLGSLSRRAGGLFNSVRRLSLSLAERGVEVSVIGLLDPDTTNDLQAWAPLNPTVLEPAFPQFLGAAKGLSEAISRTSPTVIHQHGIWLALSGTVSGWASRCPTIISPRGMLDPWALSNSSWKKSLAWHGWECRNLQRAGCIHALAAGEAQAIAKVHLNAKIVTIPNAVDLPIGVVGGRKNTTPRELLFLGRLHPKKGLPDLFHQWAALSPTLRKQWTLRVAGPDEGGHRSDLEALAAKLDIGDELDFLGAVTGSAKDEALQRASAFVLPSYSEGLPMSVLEAWSYKLPVLMTEACNLPEGFARGAALRIETGFDSRLLSEALVRSDLPEIGLLGRALVEDSFTWQSVADRYITTYKWMAGQGPIPEDLHG